MGVPVPHPKPKGGMVPGSLEDTVRRRDAVRGLLRDGGARDHDEIERRLRRRGIRATQSSISRDLRALGAAKIEGRWVLPDLLGVGPTPPAPSLEDVSGAVLDVRAAGPHLVVVQTLPAQASAVGIAIDAAAWPGVLGTVAGDDTLFVAVEGRRAQAALAARLRVSAGR